MKSLGQIAFEAAYVAMGEIYEWDRIPVDEHGYWEAAACAVIDSYKAEIRPLISDTKDFRRAADEFTATYTKSRDAALAQLVKEGICDDGGGLAKEYR